MSLILSIISLQYVASSCGILLDAVNILPYRVGFINGTTFEAIATGISSTKSVCKHHYGLNTHIFQGDITSWKTDEKQGRKLWITSPTPTPPRSSVTLSYRAKVSISIYGVVGLFIIVGTISDVLVSRQPNNTHSASKVVQRHPSCDTIQSHVDYTDADECLDGCPFKNIQHITRAHCASKWRYWQKTVHTGLLLCFVRSKQTFLSFNLKTFAKRFLLCFSLYTNGKRLLNTSVGAGTLRAVNGIRVLSLTWVLIGHTLSRCKSYSDNSKEMKRWVLQRWTYQPLENATPSVDSFFTLSGLLVSYLTLKELHRSGSKFNIFMYYFHRYFRLTAPMGMVMLFALPLMEYFGSGPHWSIQRSYCRHTWWKTIFYVGNLDVNQKGPCMGVTWYLMNDMQFYILSPIILLPLYFRPRLGIVILSMFLITTLATTGLISRTNELAAIGYQPGGKDRDKLIYNKPYTRMGPYLIGIAAGWILHRTELKLEIKWYINALIWAAAVSTGLAVIYGLVESDQQKFRLTWDVAALYNAAHRTAWGVALCWVVIAGATNNGGFVNTLLSWEPFVFLSRCSFMAYLLQHYTMEWFFDSRVRALHVTDLGVAYCCLGSISLAFIVASAATLVMEAPILSIETLFFKRERRK